MLPYPIKALVGLGCCCGLHGARRLPLPRETGKQGRACGIVLAALDTTVTGVVRGDLPQRRDVPLFPLLTSDPRSRAQWLSHGEQLLSLHCPCSCASGFGRGTLHWPFPPRQVQLHQPTTSRTKAQNGSAAFHRQHGQNV